MIVCSILTVTAFVKQLSSVTRNILHVLRGCAVQILNWLSTDAHKHILPYQKWKFTQRWYVIIAKTLIACTVSLCVQWQWTSCQTSWHLPHQTINPDPTTSAPFTSTVRAWRCWRLHTKRPWTDVLQQGMYISETHTKLSLNSSQDSTLWIQKRRSMLSKCESYIPHRRESRTKCKVLVTVEINHEAAKSYNYNSI